MQNIVIEGPCELSGEVSVQGAKNSSMKHVLMPLLANDTFTLHNIPDIGSTRKLLELVILQGAHVTWEGNTVRIDTTTVTSSQPLPAELFYYTSGAIFLIPILTFKYGSCSVEVHPERTDTGGDKIGTREFSQILTTLEKLGVENKKVGNWHHFFVNKHEAFNFEVPVRSFSASVIALIAAIFKKGSSTISNYTGEADFQDTIRFFQQAGVKISQENNKLVVRGEQAVKGISFTNMYDRHDFITLLSSALITNSSITIQNVFFEEMKLECLMPILNKIGVEIEFHKNSCRIPQQKKVLQAVEIIAGLYPLFITEWQVLFSPLLTQIIGTSSVVETVYSDRMRHWEQLGKMGAQYEFYEDKNYPEINNNPRAVRITGSVPLKGAHVTARDLRSGAALVIAGLKAEGKTIIADIDHIHRGYEHLIERLQALGANIKYHNE